ncbi:type II toxin-antitoxin system death-on-curing family toxin [Paenibacillus naphthalenovorans]|uniref:type II toxin-antitoxin system death-on-curing family toxin n=1 Tax=Paenibacillus naphthalenovorans TaxID=162209 RepID=UPI000784258E|nr:type II toxin-antitoxin system death-on-curing family toxin [Paenibacillus naphthalenovorans]
MSNIIYLDSEDIRYLHEEALIRYGGIYGEHESGMIDYMADKPSMVIFSQDQYPDLFMKAAIYLHGFATHQYFADGNKRTGVACALTFLLINNYRVIISENLLYIIAIRVAKKRLSIETLTELLRRHSIPVKI